MILIKRIHGLLCDIIEDYALIMWKIFKKLI
jgi:hypothetical protein